MRFRSVLVTATATATLVLAGTPVALAAPTPALTPTVPTLNWQPCGSAPKVTCTTVRVPRDYRLPRGPSFQLFVAKSPATDQADKIGSLFINFGGPGGTAADIFEGQGAGLFPGLNARFDIIAMDPRGVGQSQPSIDCQVNQETDGIYSKPFATPANLNVGTLLTKDARYIAACLRRDHDVLPYVSTAAVARDIDLIRQALGERQITYFGFSYGTLLGTTYASLFPTNYRAMVLDGPVDANSYINTPMSDLSAQSTGFEQALERFLQACAGDQVACHGFGGADPADAYDQLLRQLDATPAHATDGRVVNGDDARAGTALALYNKGSWRFLGHALADLQQGNGNRMQIAADGFFGRNPDGTYGPGNDTYFTIGAVEQHYPRGVTRYLQAGSRSFQEHPHFFWNNGYVELNYGLYPIHSTDVFSGPFRVHGSSPTPLVVATTFDPATPYNGALNLVNDLGNARLITMVGDGHTAYGGNSACIDSVVETYVNELTLPPAGTQCQQDVGFAAPRVQSPRLAPQTSVVGVRPHVRPMGPLG